MSFITHNNNIVEPMQTHNSIAKVRANREQESSEIDRKQEFTEIKQDTSKVGYKNVDDEKTKEVMSHSNSFSDYFSVHASELTSLPLKKARKKIVDMAEKELISKALEKTRWNRSKANRILDISYKTLLSKIRELNIQPAEQRGN